MAVPPLTEFMEEHYIPYQKERIRGWSRQSDLFKNHLQATLGNQRIDNITLHAAQLLLTPPGITHSPWQSLAPGMDLGTFSANRPSSSGDSRITILRIDSVLWSLVFVGLILGPLHP